MDYKKSSKFRSDRIDSKSSRYRDDNDDDDDYRRSKRSRSRSRSRDRSRSYSNPYASDKKKPKPSTFQHQIQPNARYEENPMNPFGASPTIEKRHGSTAPSKTLMMRQIPTQMDDSQLKAELFKMAVPYKDVRLVKDRATGLNRGFAFIEFDNVEDASSWMQSTKGSVYFVNYDARVAIFFSNTADDEAYRNKFNKEEATEWDCTKCGVRNFKRRERCFKCSISREESDKRKGGEGYEYAGANPCNTLLLRGLDALTTKETITDSLNTLTNFTLSIKNVHIARDTLSNVAMGFAFVEMNTLQDAGYLMQCFQNGFEIDGKQVMVNYSKNNFKTAITALDTQSKISYHQMSCAPEPYLAPAYGPKKGNQTDAANSAAAVAQAAMKSMAKKQEMLTHITTNMKQTGQTGSNYKDLDSTIGANLEFIASQVEKSSAPDVTQFVYDESSGFYYDYSTGYYYDPNSQYYYNSSTQQYLYWDASTSTYVPVTSTETTNEATKSEQVKPQTETVKLTPSKPKTAAQIAKDMERWAEQVNKKKEPKKTSVQKAINPAASASVAVEIKMKPVETTEAKPEEVALKQTEIQTTIKPGEIKKLNDDVTINQTQTQVQVQAKSEDLDETNLIDLQKIACLLCKRRFDSIEILNKHVAKSDLHKTNLEKLRGEKAPIETEKKDEEKKLENSDSLSAALKYRDRAMERRKKYGSPEPPSPPTEYSAKLKMAKELYEEESAATVASAVPFDLSYGGGSGGTSSVASKLMKKMGWSEGSGIGKNLQGISAPIEATLRQKGAGLGASSVEIEPTDTYQDAVKKSARARFEQLSQKF